MKSDGERRRFCVGCQKHVHDLSGLTEAAAGAVIERERGPVCIRFAVDAHGEARFEPETVAAPILRRMTVAAGFVLATLSGCVDPVPESVFDEGCRYSVAAWEFTVERGQGRCAATPSDSQPPNIGETKLGVERPEWGDHMFGPPRDSNTRDLLLAHIERKRQLEEELLARRK
jgi:hypothetical protein